MGGAAEALLGLLHGRRKEAAQVPPNPLHGREGGQPKSHPTSSTDEGGSHVMLDFYLLHGQGAAQDTLSRRQGQGQRTVHLSSSTGGALSNKD